MDLKAQDFEFGCKISTLTHYTKAKNVYEIISYLIIGLSGSFLQDWWNLGPSKAN
jgi:hypothetical protein